MILVGELVGVERTALRAAAHMMVLDIGGVKRLQDCQPGCCCGQRAVIFWRGVFIERSLYILKLAANRAGVNGSSPDKIIAFYPFVDIMA
jgi:hypothetical protein